MTEWCTPGTDRGSCLHPRSIMLLQLLQLKLIVSMTVSNIPINTDPEKSAAVIRITQKKFRGRDTKSIWFTRRSVITKADRMCVLYISDPADLVNQQLAACSSKWGLADGLWCCHWMSPALLNITVTCRVSSVKWSMVTCAFTTWSD